MFYFPGLGHQTSVLSIILTFPRFFMMFPRMTHYVIFQEHRLQVKNACSTSSASMKPGLSVVDLML